MLVAVDVVVVVIVVDGVSRPRFRFRVEEASMTASSMSKFAADGADESEEPLELSLRSSSFTSRGLACAATWFAVNALSDVANERV